MHNAAVSRIGILGDIHAEDEALLAALRHFERDPVDTILAVGDIVDGKGSVDACCAALRAAGAIVVRGNHERWFLHGDMRSLPDSTNAADISTSTREFLATLPVTHRLATVRGDLLLCHGMGEDDMCTVRPDDFGYAIEVNDALQALVRAGDVNLVVSGHSHRRMVRRVGSLTLVNAGTLFREHAPCFGTIDLCAGVVTFFERRGEAVVTAEVVDLPRR